MTKEEKIKEAYGELFETHSHLIDSAGWLNNGDRDDYLTMGQTEFLGEFEYINDTFFRPVSLKGIQDNNGWIKIESKKDLPKSDQMHYLVFSKNEIKKSSFNVHQVEAGYQFGEITHYKPIIFDKPPIH